MSSRHFLDCLRRLALPALACALLVAPAAWAQQKTVGITAIVEHPALDAIRHGAEQELRAQGWSAEQLKVQYQSAQGNTATAGQIAKKFAGDKVDAILAIGTPSAQAAVAATRAIPIVYAGVTDPVAAKLVKSMAPSGGNVTGVSDQLALAPQVDLILKIKPGAKKVGMVYSPGEVNSTVVVQQMKDELQKRGLTLVEAAAPRTVDVAAAARALAGKVDVIYTSTDNNVVSTYDSLIGVARQAKVPLVASDSGSVQRGASAGLSVDYREMGRQAGRMLARILKGESPGAIASETGTAELLINPTAAASQGVTLDDALRQQARAVP